MNRVARIEASQRRHACPLVEYGTHLAVGSFLCSLLSLPACPKEPWWKLRLWQTSEVKFDVKLEHLTFQKPVN
jgi:hypothetical protein